jgi:hypothetical protein
MVWWNLQFTSWWQQRDAWQYGKALIDAVEHVKNAPIQGRFTDAKRTRYEHKRVHGKRQQYNDYCSSKDDKASTPLDKYTTAWIT